MSDYAPPSADPADDDSMVGVLRATFKKQLQSVDDMLPAVVVAYDRDLNRANVRALIAVLTTDSRAIQRAPLASIPVMQFGGGGMMLNFNLKPGDIGWIKANDRDISVFLQSYGDTTPNTVRLHSFQDAVFIPDVMKGWTISGDDAEAAVLQTLDGSAKVSVQPGRVQLEVDGNSVTVTPSMIELAVGGKSVTVDASGTTIVGGLVIDGIAFGPHFHSDPQGGNTSGPLN